MVSCVVCGTAKSVHSSVKPAVTFHVFPKDPLQREIWIKFVNKPDWEPTSRTVICSKHFTDDCFDRTSLSVVRLRPQSVPTIYVQRQKYVKGFNPEILFPVCHPSTSSEGLPVPSTSTQCAPVAGPSTLKHFVMEIPTSVPSSLQLSLPRPSTSSETSAPAALQAMNTSLEEGCHTPPRPQEVSFVPSTEDSPRKLKLKRALQEMAIENNLKTKKIRHLQKENWRLKTKLTNLHEMMEELKKKNLMEDEMVEIFTNKFGKNKDLFSRLFYKSHGKPVPKKYSEDIRTFALTLHFFSPKAYNYVRETMDSCLPHAKTLSKWYANINAKPGFTSEAIEMLKLKTRHSENKVICSLVMDEMAIRKQVEWDGEKYIGLVTFGATLEDPAVGEATQALVFMIVSINEAWKVPIGYFFIHTLTSVQKTELVKQCLHVLSECNVIITNLTFDGAPTNFTMVKQLGCDLDINNLKTEVTVDNNTLFILPDPSHMIKLVRNLFGELKILFNGKGEKIDFSYIQKLNQLQKNEGLHLANKLRQQHVLFFKQKMKTKLATQLLSRSVAESLIFCRDILQLAEFSDCGATAEFILLMNDAFDILNSRKLGDFGLKQAMCEANITKIKEFYVKFFNYVSSLKLPDNRFVINSNRKTGLLGMIIGLYSIQCIFTYFVAERSILKFVPIYKLCQDHLELFFGTIRSQGGHNDNPTCRQFIAAYKKILIHAEIREGGMGNCIPLDQINILYSSSETKKPAEDLINEENVIYNETNNIIDVTDMLVDHDYIFGTNLTEYSKQIVIYIAGFVVTKISSKLKCEHCISHLCGRKEQLVNSFLNFKDRGALTYPSNLVVKLCLCIEKVIRVFNHQNLIMAPNVKTKIEMDVINHFLGSNMFQEINNNHDNTIRDHALLLTKCIIKHYLNVRIQYICKQMSDKNSVRNYYKKIILFKGQ